VAITKLVPNTVLVIVMLSVHMISNSSTVLPTLRAGNHQLPTRTLVPVNTDRAVLRWTFGKPTPSHLLSLLIHVLSMDSINVQELNAETMIPAAMVDTMVSAIRMVAI